MKKENGISSENYVNRADHGFPNEKKYLVEAKWWRKWCDFTGFDATTTKTPLDQDQKDSVSSDYQLKNLASQLT